MQLPYSRLFFYVALISITSSISSEAIDHKKQLPIASSTTGGDGITAETTSSAREGVTLLEHIMEKMRNLPQIAINKGQTIAMAPGPAAGFGNCTTANAPVMSVQAKKTEKAEDAFSSRPPYIIAKELPKLEFPKQYQIADKSPIATPVAKPSALPDINDSYNIAPRPEPVKIPSARCLLKSNQNGYFRGQRATTMCEAGRGLPASTIVDYRQSLQGETKQSIGGPNIALLPPTVIKGISLIRLGNSEEDLAKAIVAQGRLKLKKESIHGWSVWSLRNGKSANYAIQVFLRNGKVDAIRVFDPAFFPSDFGVSVGDSLSTVKEKFGEPTFILSDDAPITSQNYIYPISQAGFRFSRTEKDQSPKVTSMIVFNVQ